MMFTGQSTQERNGFAHRVRFLECEHCGHKQDDISAVRVSAVRCHKCGKTASTKIELVG